MPDSTSDRNLLFGILALQMDFIARDALVAAMHAWVLRKATPLGQILLEQGALRPDTHALLDALVQKHLEVHGGDAEKSLAAVSSVGSLRKELQQIADEELHASLGHVAAARDGDDDPFATDPHAAGALTSAGLRFRVLRPHARGGLGEVFVALDAELHREVALKEIQGRHADDPDSRARFLLEAEITGSLEHPGIVPVYGLGQYGDGRPYYAMRFIKGANLQEAIVRFHKAAAAGRDPGDQILELRQLLRRFVDVCNAIAYAHSRGVLHRDLKPGNVMLGKYGETLVVDWGLAKVLGQSVAEENGTHSECLLQPQPSESATPTQMGSAIGTPAYMPPEQAAGRLDRLGPASDVYSLGAILYCLLTGKNPFEGGDAPDILRRVQAGDFATPRTVRRAVPAALEAVCLKAMALRPEDRYGTPRALAADIEKWLADEPVGAWREPWWLRAGRWARRHQALTAAAATGLLLTVLGTGSAAWWLDRQRTEQRRGVEAALAEVARLQGENRWKEARAVLGQARDRLGENGPHDLRNRLEQGKRNLDLVAQLDAIRLNRATVSEDKGYFAAADRKYEEAFQAAGLGEVGGNTGVAAAWVSGSGVREALVAALDDWAICAAERDRRAWLLEVARRADPDPWRDRVRDPTVWEDERALARLAAGRELTKQPPQLLAALGYRLDQLGVDAELLLRTAQETYPADYWINFALAKTLWLNKPVEALAYYRAALASRPGTDAVYSELGLTLWNLGRLEEAIAEFRRSIQVEPKNAQTHYNLARCQQMLALDNKLTAILCQSRIRRGVRQMIRLPKCRVSLGLILFLAAFSKLNGAAADTPARFDGEKSAWHDGFDRYDYLMDEQTLAIQPFKRGENENFGIQDPPRGKRRCVVIVPKRAAAGNPWSWRGCYWDHQPQVEVELLRRGFHMVYLSANAALKPGKPWDAWYTFLTEKHGLSGIPLLHVCGSLDPMLEDHTRAAEKRYKELGGSMSVIVQQGIGHYPTAPKDPNPVVDFILGKQETRETKPKAAPQEKPAALTREQIIEQTMKPFQGTSVKGVDRSTLTGKVMCGYQGWHAAEGDGCGRGWYHWTGRRGFRPGSTNVDLWPDVSELDPRERYATPFRTADGKLAEVYSAFNARTVIRHFQWMREYGIDGVFVQRFAVEVFNPLGLRQFNTVLDHCREGANKYGRTYAVMYDLSGMRADQMSKVMEDWKLLTEKMRITKDPAYLHHNGRPVVAVWGFGFSDGRKYTLKEGLELVAFLKSKEGGECTVMLGVPTYWRTLERDAVNDKMLHELISKADIVSPWTVGRFGTPEQAANYAEKTMGPDIAWCKERKKEYLPVVFPGFSWHNQNPRFPLNSIPRRGGRFLWSQFVSAKKAGATMIYQAMFDEVDEGTAIYKCTNDVPVGESKFATFEGLPSDFYLKLVGAGTKMLRGDFPLADEMPSLDARKK